MKNPNLKKLYFITIAYTTLLISSCYKQDIVQEYKSGAIDSSVVQANYLAKIKAGLKDSLNASDFATIDFLHLYKSNSVLTGDHFLRISIARKKLSDDFVLLSTDSIGNIIKARIVHVQHDGKQKGSANFTMVASSLNRKEIVYLKNTESKNRQNENREKANTVTSNNISSMMEEEAPAGEQTLPDVVVVGYIYDNPTSYYWYCFDDILGMGSGGGGGSTYTYGSADPQPHGGGSGPVYPDETINISYENADQSPIDVTKYVNCFSQLSDQGATFKITIYTDIPVNNDPYKLFDFSTGACGHTFLQLTKSNGSTSIQQNIGFYPETGWKSIEANGPVPSKMVDNAGHEFNASLTVNIDATHFQNALNEIQYQSKSRYDIDNFNCTDFALSVFNLAAYEPLEIPQYHIPGGMMGELSNTPQGLYIELSDLSKTGGYEGGEILIPGVAGYVGASHGPCN
ncbi:hypothetical protein [Parafilimonas sp.]|uniref:hypothetical protein n=1 Tax=Parafilimonas sp. TaxID=1969739 RepID=UPI0039E59DF5